MDDQKLIPNPDYVNVPFSGIEINFEGEFDPIHIGPPPKLQDIDGKLM